MRWQLLLLLGLAVFSLAYDLEVTYSDAEEALDELMDDSGKFRTSEALDLLQERGFRDEITGRSTKLPVPLVAAAAVGTLAKIALLVLIGTGTIPATYGNNTIPAPIVGVANTTTAALVNLKKILTGINTVTALVEIDISGITGQLFLAQSSSLLGGSSTTLVTGTLKGLTKNVSYRMDVAIYGDLANGCDAAGALYSNKSGGVFVADSSGRALLLIQAEDAPLTGNNSVMGRSVVITKEADTTKRLACGTIVRD